MRIVYSWPIEKIEKRDREENNPKLLNMVGGNTGNVCFCDAIREQMIFEDEVMFYDIKDYPTDDSLFVLGGSNWINLNDNFLKTCFLPLKNKDCHFLVLGIGIQKDSEMSVKDFLTSLKSDKELRTSLEILSEKSWCIGVRGSITGEILDGIGIHNWKVIGCPSFYSIPLENRIYNQIYFDNVAINVTTKKREDYRTILWGMNNQADVILQSRDDMPGIVWFGEKVEKRHIQSRFPDCDEKINETNYYEYIKNYGKIFYARKNWSDYLKKRGTSFVFGGRFHGNMMALSNGIPALWIERDDRIKEMAEAMLLPIVNSENLYRELDDIKHGKRIYGESFRNNYQKMWKEYIGLIEKCGITHNLQM